MIRHSRIIYVFYLNIFGVLFLHNSISAQSRRESFNEGWEFKKDTVRLESVKIPHTWNKTDPFDDESGYFRGQCSYYKSFNLSKGALDHQLFLKFEGVNQVAKVFVNERLATTHRGGYTAFYVPLNLYVKEGINQIEVRVNNAHDPAIVPLRGDFNFYGGIYRDIWLERENEIHFSKSSYGSEGVYLTPVLKASGKGILHTRLLITNTGLKKQVTLDYVLLDKGGKEIYQTERNLLLGSGENEQIESILVDDPGLWSPEDPNLYYLQVRIRSDKKVFDEFYSTCGFRTFEFDADSGFFLNGKPIKLIGSNRHQDFFGKGNALTDDYHRRDVRLLKSMGSNFFRTAHYPQDQSVLDESDRLGLLVSMEIPLDHELTDSEDFYSTTRQMMLEMIHQHYNHPSIVIWAYMNEMFLGRNLERDKEDLRVIVDFARKMEELTRASDSTRYTMIPNHGDFSIYYESGLLDIPQIIGWNLYFGWYEEGFEKLSGFLRSYNEKVQKPVIITEYGAGSDPRIRSLNPHRFDFSVDWQFAYHQSYLRQINQLDFLSGAAVWNLFDFGSEFRQDAVPHINSKGLMTFDRLPKDAYFLYKSQLTENPFGEILPTLFPLLPKTLDSDTIYWPIKVVSNLERARISVNGVSYPEKRMQHGVVEWKVPLVGDELRVTAVIEGSQTITIQKKYRLSSELNINLGADFYFHHPETDQLWIPEKEYASGKGYGITGGQIYRPRSAGIGVSKGVNLTDIDPVYQTQNQGINEIVFDVEFGTYEVEFLYARIDPSLIGRFEVYTNEQLLHEINTSELPEFTAISKIHRVITEDLKIRLVPVEGTTFLNGIKLTKIN